MTSIYGPSIVTNSHFPNKKYPQNSNDVQILRDYNEYIIVFNINDNIKKITLKALFRVH